MNDNPYAAPATTAQGIIGGDLKDLRAIASAQRGIIFCILGNVALIVSQMGLNQVARENVAATPMILAFQFGLMICGVCVMIAAIVFTFRLARKIFGTVAAVFCAILMLVPLLSLILLLVLSSRATSILRKNGIRVGLLGASKAQVDARIATLSAAEEA